MAEDTHIHYNEYPRLSEAFPDQLTGPVADSLQRLVVAEQHACGNLLLHIDYCEEWDQKVSFLWLCV
jgi:hypothetical protein